MTDRNQDRTTHVGDESGMEHDRHATDRNTQSDRSTQSDGSTQGDRSSGSERSASSGNRSGSDSGRTGTRDATDPTRMNGVDGQISRENRESTDL